MILDSRAKRECDTRRVFIWIRDLAEEWLKDYENRQAVLDAAVKEQLWNCLWTK